MARTGVDERTRRPFKRAQSKANVGVSTFASTGGIQTFRGSFGQIQTKWHSCEDDQRNGCRLAGCRVLTALGYYVTAWSVFSAVIARGADVQFDPERCD